jgi:hypothetical protein
VAIVSSVTAGAEKARGVVQAIHRVSEGENGGQFVGGRVVSVIDGGRGLWSLSTEAQTLAKSLLGKVRGKGREEARGKQSRAVRRS